MALPPELAAYMVVVVLPGLLPCHVNGYELSLSFQWDLMMGLEKIRAVAPEHADNGTSVLAAALCLMPALGRSRATYANLGCAYTEEPLTEAEVEKLKREKFVPDSCVKDLAGGRKRLLED